ncbi:hypothetical protein ACMD2_22142, partial [Ananas comosus]
VDLCVPSVPTRQ